MQSNSDTYSTDKSVLHLLNVDNKHFEEKHSDDSVCYSLKLPESSVQELLQGWRSGKDLSITLPQLELYKSEKSAEAAFNLPAANITIGEEQYKIDWIAENAPEDCVLYREAFPDRVMYPYAQLQGRYMGKTTVQQSGSSSYSSSNSYQSLNSAMSSSTRGQAPVRSNMNAAKAPSGGSVSPIIQANTSSPITRTSPPSVPRQPMSVPVLPSTAKGVLRKLRDAGSTKETRKRVQPPRPLTTVAAPLSESDRESTVETKTISQESNMANSELSDSKGQSKSKKVRLDSLQAASSSVELANKVLKESRLYAYGNADDAKASEETRPVLKTRDDLLAMAADTNRLNNIYEMLRNWIQRQAKIVQEAESKMVELADEYAASHASEMKLSPSNVDALKEMLSNLVKRDLTARAEPIAEAHAACKLLLKELQCRGDIMKKYLGGGGQGGE